MSFRNYIKGDSGAALLVALLVGMVLIMIVVGAHRLSTTHSREQQVTATYEEAFQNAESGINWFIYKANDDETFVSRLVRGEIDLDQMVEDELDGVVDNLEFDPQITGDVDYASVEIMVESTGVAENPVTGENLERTIEYEIENRQFVNFVWLTNAETAWFSCMHELRGPVHSNGRLRIRSTGLDDVTFHDTVTQSYDDDVNWGENVDDEECLSDDPDDGNFRSGYPETGADRVDYPPDNQELRDIAAEEGLLYDGLTRINIDGNEIEVREGLDGDVDTESIDEDGMVIYVKGESNYHEETCDGVEEGEQFDSIEEAKSECFECGGVEVGVGWWPNYEEKTLYCDVCGEKDNFLSTEEDCGCNDGCDNCFEVCGREVECDDCEDAVKFDEDAADVYISGELDGRLTIAAERDIWISGYNTVEDWSAEQTGGVTYYGITSDTGQDWDWRDPRDQDAPESMLGLIANNNIQIFDGGWFCDGIGSDSDSVIDDLHIHAALYAGDGALEYRSAGWGGIDGEDVYLRGSLAKDYRTAILSNGVGYGRDFRYDPRLFYEMPPDFLEPVESGWTKVRFRETTGN